MENTAHSYTEAAECSPENPPRTIIRRGVLAEDYET